MATPLLAVAGVLRKAAFSGVAIADPVSLWMALGSPRRASAEDDAVQRRIEVMTRFRRPALVLVLLVVALLAARPGSAGAASDKSPVVPVNPARGGAGVKGYHPVAYFTVGQPTPGVDQYPYRWKGVTY